MAPRKELLGPADRTREFKRAPAQIAWGSLKRNSEGKIAGTKAIPTPERVLSWAPTSGRTWGYCEADCGYCCDVCCDTLRPVGSLLPPSAQCRTTFLLSASTIPMGCALVVPQQPAALDLQWEPMGRAYRPCVYPYLQVFSNIYESEKNQEFRISTNINKYWE
mmetsp:Transcript_62734/g.104314  ORF Transcript_62734/g.104314 Transcript_62734/m.104314 type:complete len:163 (+) Transcript_62734:340-828(+)